MKQSVNSDILEVVVACYDFCEPLLLATRSSYFALQLRSWPGLSYQSGVSIHVTHIFEHIRYGLM